MTTICNAPAKGKTRHGGSYRRNTGGRQYIPRMPLTVASQLDMTDDDAALAAGCLDPSRLGDPVIAAHLPLDGQPGHVRLYDIDSQAGGPNRVGCVWAVMVPAEVVPKVREAVNELVVTWGLEPFTMPAVTLTGLEQRKNTVVALARRLTTLCTDGG